MASILSSKEMFINMDKPPIYNPRKSYYDQSRDVLQFFEEEKSKIINGVYIGGYFVHPWLYYHLNFFKTPIPLPNKTEKIMSPPLDDNIMFVTDNYKQAEEENKGLCLFGTRGFAKAERNDEPLLYTDKVWRPIGDAEVGDEIYGADGKPTKILGVYPQGKVPLYEITLRDGRKVVTCDEHLWHVYDGQARCYKTLPLKEVMKGYINKKNGTESYNYYIPINKYIDFSEENLPEDPYYIGLYSDNSLVPNLYLKGSKDQRESLLQGLIDSYKDNVKSKSLLGKDEVEINFYKKDLAIQLRDLSNSLGVHASILEEGENWVVTLHISGERSSHSAIVDIQRVEDDYATCIRVDNEDKLFITRDYIVTHNSTDLASLTSWINTIKANGTSSIVGGSDKDLSAISKLLEQNFVNTHPAFAIPRIKSDWESDIQFGIKEKSGEKLLHSSISITNVNNGSKRKSEAGAGLSPVSYIMDEIGKYECKAVLQSALPSFRTQYGSKLVHLLSGCVCAGTKVWNNKGELVNIEDLKQEDGILGFDGNKVTKEPITWMKPPAEKSCYRISTEGGHTIECSDDHPFLVRTHNSLKGVRAVALVEGMQLLKPSEIVDDVDTEEIKSLPFKMSPNGKFEIYEGKILSNLVAYTITDVEYIGKKLVYNLTAGNTHTYLANGFVTSNTGGNKKLSQDAKDILANPDAFGLIMMNWDRLDSSVPEEAITWDRSKKQTFSVFVPGQMSYRRSTLKKDQKLSEYLGIKSKDLDNINIKVTDWVEATKSIKKEINSLKKEEDRQKVQMYFPLEIDDCFLTESNNPFPVSVINKHIRKLEDSGEVGKDIGLYRDVSNYKYEFINKKRAEVSHGGGVADAPIILFKEFPDKLPPRGLYVAGLDGYKIDVSDTDSLGSAYVIKRRNQEPNQPCETIVASYTARPEKMRDFNINCEKLFDTWNAECLMESIDLSFKQHLEEKGRENDVLAPAITFSGMLSKKKSKLNSKFGLYPNIGNNQFRFNLLVSFCWEEHTVGIDDEGNKIIKHGVEFLDDIGLLKEMLNWYKGGNFDRITAFSHALVYARELDKKNILPDKRDNSVELSEKEYKRKQKLLSNNRYGRISKVRRY